MRLKNLRPLFFTILLQVPSFCFGRCHCTLLSCPLYCPSPWLFDQVHFLNVCKTVYKNFAKSILRRTRLIGRLQLKNDKMQKKEKFKSILLLIKYMTRWVCKTRRQRQINRLATKIGISTHSPINFALNLCTHVLYRFYVIFICIPLSFYFCLPFAVILTLFQIWRSFFICLRWEYKQNIRKVCRHCLIFVLSI